MSDVNQLLRAMHSTVRAAQADLDIAAKAAFSATLKDSLAQQQEELDSLESELLTSAARRGWELSEFGTITDSFEQAKLRVGLLFHCTDSRIVQLLICRHINSMNRNLKLLHRLEPVPDHSRTLFQKMTDFQHDSIRKLQLFL